MAKFTRVKAPRGWTDAGTMPRWALWTLHEFLRQNELMSVVEDLKGQHSILRSRCGYVAKYVSHGYLMDHRLLGNTAYNDLEENLSRGAGADPVGGG